jgi:hypothetical protein
VFGNFFGVDIYAARSPTAGVLYLGSDGSRYLYNDGAKYQLNGWGLSTDGSLGVGIGAAAAPLTSLDIRTAANQHFVATANAGVGIIGFVNDGFAAWQDAMILGGNRAVWPIADNAATCGATGHRWTQLWSVSGTIQTSDARLKKNVQDSTLGLAFVEALRPVSYQWINGGNVVSRAVDGEEMLPAHTLIDGTEVAATTRPIYKDVVTPTEGKRTHYGLIAQEVRQAVAASGVVDFGGFVQTDLADPESELGLNYGEFIAPLIKAVQELSARVRDLEARLANG